MNLCLLIGQVGTDPALALGYTNAGRPSLRFRLAVSSEDGKDKPATWVTVACWEELAEEENRSTRFPATVSSPRTAGDHFPVRMAALPPTTQRR
jgi:hypothetical protein